MEAEGEGMLCYCPCVTVEVIPLCTPHFNSESLYSSKPSKISKITQEIMLWNGMDVDGVDFKK
jgi:hypothetical protein